MDLYPNVGANMNELIDSFKQLPYTIKNASLESRYSKKLYTLYLVVNLALISFVFLLLNLTSSLPIDKSTRLWQLSGLLMFTWISSAIYFSSLKIKARGFLLNISNIPIYILSNVQIINFFVLFFVSFILLQWIRLSNHIDVEMSFLGIIYFLILTMLLLIPICTLFALTMHIRKNMKWFVIGTLLVLFLSLPILWVPSNVPEMLVNLLRLNPFYFVVNGFQESVVLGSSAFYNIPSHLIFWIELAFIYIWFNYIYELLKDEINVNKQ